MGRYTPSNSRDHHIRKIGPDHYRISWSVDFYYANSTLRHPRAFRRDTDLAGAKRFAKRWGVDLPDQAPKVSP